MENRKLVILCGPSGSGKTTVAHHLLKAIPELSFSISATTRQKRHSESNQKDYYFLPVEEFTRLIAENEFVEFEEVYKGAFYGTLKSELNRIWESGKVPLLDIDVIGALNIKEYYAPHALGIFVHPVTIENIHGRLKKRATETDESLQKRIERAVDELKMAEMFDRVVYNDQLENACRSAEKFVMEYIVNTKSLSA